jgi:hypothetical protein
MISAFLFFGGGFFLLANEIAILRCGFTQANDAQAHRREMAIGLMLCAVVVEIVGRLP